MDSVSPQVLFICSYVEIKVKKVNCIFKILDPVSEAGKQMKNQGSIFEIQSKIIHCQIEINTD